LTDPDGPMAPVTAYRFRRWGGRTETVRADRVVFMPGHVVFYKADWTLVLAVRNDQINDIREIPEKPEGGD
jgi:hypothetical protein